MYKTPRYLGIAELMAIKLFRHPLFLVGLAIRLVLISIADPYAAFTWYVPFMESTLTDFSLDPWQGYLDAEGDQQAFPYGYVMWLILLPLTSLFSIIGLEGYFGYATTLLAVDALLLYVLKKFLNIRNQLLLVAYWLSPIVIFATYWLGFNDLIPVTLLCCGLYAFRQQKPILSGVLCAAAVSAKLSMVLPIPFLVIYLFRTRSVRHLWKGFAVGLSCGLVAFIGPFLLSAAGMVMLFKNPEMQKTYEFAIAISDSVKVYILPLAYLFMLYVAWQVRRITFELFYAILSIAFLLVLLCTPAAPGWFLWFIPLVLGFLAHGKLQDTIVITLFSLVYVISVFLIAEQPVLLGTTLATDTANTFRKLAGTHGINLLNTGLLALGLVIALRIWRGAVSENDYFRLSRKPVVLGVAGDSGAGKDFLVDGLIDLFGKHSSVHISGDDYHLWDRHKPMWQVLTHLNPKANDLERFAKDLMALIDGKSISSRHYDHEIGKMTLPRVLDSNDFILASGLHTMHLPILRNCYDLSIYLDIDEDLRRYFKIERDVKQRGHTLEKVLASIKKRERDSEKFVRPQAEYADLVLSLKPANPEVFNSIDEHNQLRLKLVVVSRLGMNEESLKRVLVGICGLYVDMNVSEEKNEIALTIEGDTTGEDIALAAKSLFSEILEFLDYSPKWKDGVSGLMQLVVLSHINQSLSRRLL